tara:strand:- start:4369 stop:5028 length:660 start_codon:yes stop_codon:yes gene_type:complete
MPTPANRTPIRIARGTYTNLNSSLSDIQEGEICYATDQDKLYVKEGSSLVDTSFDVNNAALTGVPTAPTASTGTNTTQIATTAFVAAAVPTIDPDTAKTDVEQLFTAGQRGQITELSAGTSFTIDLDASNNFLIQPNGTYTVTLNNISGSKGQCGSIFIKPTAAAASGSFPTTMKFVGGAAGIALTGTSGAIDRIDYIVQDDNSGYECLTCNFTANYVS